MYSFKTVSRGYHGSLAEAVLPSSVPVIFKGGCKQRKVRNRLFHTNKQDYILIKYEP